MEVAIQMYQGNQACGSEVFLLYEKSEADKLKVKDIAHDVKKSYLGSTSTASKLRSLGCYLYLRGSWIVLEMRNCAIDLFDEEVDDYLNLDVVFAEPGKPLVDREPREEPIDQLLALPDFGAPRQAKRQKISTVKDIRPSADNTETLKFLSREQLSVSANSFCLSVTSDLLSEEIILPDHFIPAAKDFLVTVQDGEVAARRDGDMSFLNGESFYTSEFSAFLNLVAPAGSALTFTYQASCGTGNTHMDFSGRKHSGVRFISLVGEAKTGNEATVRVQPLSQNLNELIRSRAIDKALNEVRSKEQHALSQHCPILLVLLNKSYISVRLAFFGKAGSIVEEFYKAEKDLTNGSEFFIAAEVAFVRITQDDAGAAKLARLAHFLLTTMERLHDNRNDLGKEVLLSKTPWNDAPGEVKAVQYFGKNVTHIEFAGNLGQYIYKEFCYYLRCDDGFNEPVLTIPEEDRRLAPPQEVLDSLGEKFPWYKSWETVLDDKRRSITIIRYPYKKGSHVPQSVSQFLDVIKQAEIIHRHKMVFSDYHTGNVLFDTTNGFTYDFDLMRNVGEPYVAGFKKIDGFRHAGAKAGAPTATEHDVFALAKMAEFYFSCLIRDTKAFEDLSALRLYLETHQDDLNARERPELFAVAKATGSLNIQATYYPS